MNFKKHAEKLEHFLEEEFNKKIPIIILPNKDLLYKRFRIRKAKDNIWEIMHLSGDLIDKFYLKATAVLAAKFYDVSRFDKYNEIKNLDIGYWSNSLDSVIFLSRLKQTNNIDKKLLYMSRHTLTAARAARSKQLISSMFRNNF